MAMYSLQNIESIVEDLSKEDRTKVRIALVEFRDHRPEEYSFTARANDFSYDVKKIKQWLQRATARGGQYCHKKQYIYSKWNQPNS